MGIISARYIKAPLSLRCVKVEENLKKKICRCIKFEIDGKYVNLVGKKTIIKDIRGLGKVFSQFIKYLTFKDLKNKVLKGNIWFYL